MSVRTFISYRRQDNADFAERIRDKFVDRYGREYVFIDFDSIPPASKWKECIEREISNCQLFVIIIGPEWLNILKQKAASFVEDIVVYEIELAIQQNKVIAPICIKKAMPPSQLDLPPSIRSILNFNFAFLDSGQSFSSECENIIDAIEAQIKQPTKIDGHLSETIYSMVKLRLEIPENKFNADELIKIITQLVSIGVKDISIVSISSGSVIIQLQLPNEAALEFLQLIVNETKELDSFNISEAYLISSNNSSEIPYLLRDIKIQRDSFKKRDTFQTPSIRSGITVQWDNDEKTVIRYDFQGYWDWTEFREKAIEAFILTRSVDHKVDTISNFLPGTTIPRNALSQFRNIMTEAPENRGVNCIVGVSVFIRTLVNVFSRLYPQLGERIIVAASLADARAILKKRRVS
jgi:hypothetical protein